MTTSKSQPLSEHGFAYGVIGSAIGRPYLALYLRRPHVGSKIAASPGGTAATVALMGFAHVSVTPPFKKSAAVRSTFSRTV